MLRVDTSVRLDLPWETLEGMLKGISAVDMNQMTVHSEIEAEQFLLNYGFDFQNPEDQAELQRIQTEAISFIERRFLDQKIAWEGLGVERLVLHIPENITDHMDSRHLLILASTGNGIEQRWACAILKVMHIICHINNTILYRYFEEAKSQILSRFHQAISYTESGELLLGQDNDLKIKLVGFEIKDEKSRDSIILKLLCKRENVVEEVFDMIGVRLITETPAEAIMAMEILRRDKIVIFPNLIPSRSRNSLIDFDEFKVDYHESMEAYRWGQISLKETLEQIANISTNSPNEIFNPKNSSSLASYRSIHLTQRQLIRVKSQGQQETRFFFPYEIQIVDQANYAENHSGSSAHSLYKQNQLVQARRRVLGPLFITLRRSQRRAHQNMEPEPLS